MADQEPDRSFFDTVIQLFNRRPTADASPPAISGMLFDDRVALIADLLALKHRRSPSFSVWAAEVSARLKQDDAMKPLATVVDKLIESIQRGSTEVQRLDEQEESVKVQNAQALETQLLDVLDSALRLAERHPVAALSRDVRFLIADTAEQAMLRSTPLNALRWLLPILVAVLLGGAVYGGYKIQGLWNGLEQQAHDFREQLNNDRLETTAQRAAWIREFSQKLDNEAKAKTGELTVLVDNAKRTAEASVKEQVDGLPRFFENQKSKFLSDQESIGKAILSKRTADITDELNAKQKDVQGKVDALNESFAAFNKTLEADLAKAADPEQLRSLKQRLADLDKTAEELQALGKETRTIRAIVENQPTLNPNTPERVISLAMLIKILSIKDYLAIVALVVSLLAVAVTLVIWWKERKMIFSRAPLHR